MLGDLIYKAHYMVGKDMKYVMTNNYGYNFILFDKAYSFNNSLSNSSA